MATSPLSPGRGAGSEGGLSSSLATAHQWDAANQAAVAYFGWAGAQPVVGDWFDYTSAAQRASLPAAAPASPLPRTGTTGVLPQAGAAAVLPQAAAVSPRVVAAVQSPFVAASSPGGDAAQEQGSPLAPVPSASGSGSTGTSATGSEAVAADHDHEYMVRDMLPDMLPARPAGLVAIDPQAVDRIDLAAVVKTALGGGVRLRI